MNLKILLPMGEKPPDILGRGEVATPTQAPIVLSFPNACQILEELSVLLSAILRSTARSFIVIIFYGTGPPSLVAVDRIMFGKLKQRLPAHWNHCITHTTTTATNNVCLFTAIIIDITCLSLPAGGRVELVPSMPSIPCQFFPKQQHPSPNVAPTTAARSFIVIQVSAACLPPSIIGHGMVPATSALHLHASINLLLPLLIIMRRLPYLSTSPFKPSTVHSLLSFGLGTSTASPLTNTTFSLFIVTKSYDLDIPPAVSHQKCWCLQYHPPYFLLHDIADLPTDSPSDFAAVSTATTPTYHHVCSFHVTNSTHGNHYLLYQFVFLLPHAATWAAKYSAPSSIYDGALTILVQPSFKWWTGKIQPRVLYPRQHNLAPF
jgi:hypothetical protein